MKSAIDISRRHANRMSEEHTFRRRLFTVFPVNFNPIGSQKDGPPGKKNIQAIVDRQTLDHLSLRFLGCDGALLALDPTVHKRSHGQGACGEILYR